MPSTTQTRNERIKQLANEFKKNNIQLIDPIFMKARSLFPKVTRKTVMSYARAVLRIQQQKGRAENG